MLDSAVSYFKASFTCPLRRMLTAHSCLLRLPAGAPCCRCGPARHSRLLAARGLRGVAVDNCPAMIEHASELAQQEGASVEFVTGDIRQQCLPVSRGSVTAPIAAELVSSGSLCSATARSTAYGRS